MSFEHDSNVLSGIVSIWELIVTDLTDEFIKRPIPRFVTLSGITTVSREVHLLNAKLPMDFSLSEMGSTLSESQPENAYEPMSVISPHVKSTSEVQSENRNAPIVVTFGITTDLRLVHFSKQKLPSLSTFFMSMLVREVQFLNAYSPISIVLSGMDISLSDLQ